MGVSSIEKLPKSRVRLRIEVPAAEARPFLERAARELSKGHAPKGFRPGNAPLDIMRSVVGDRALLEAALKLLVPHTYIEALLEHEEIEAIGKPEVTVERMDFEVTWAYAAEVVVLPAVTLGDYRSLREKRRAVSVESAEADQELEILRKMRASYLTVRSAAKTGDRVEVDILGKADGVPIEPGPRRRQPVLLGEHTLVPGFEDQLVGMREGETKTFALALPLTHSRADLRGRTVEFTVTMGTVQQPVLPVLDDAFARGLGTFDNLRHLRETLLANIQAEKEHRERERHQQELLDRVVAVSTFGEFPEVLLEREIEAMLAELRAGVQARGMPFEAYLARIKKTASDVRAGLQAQARSRVSAGLVLRAIAKSERIEVTEEEIVSEANETVRRFSSPQEAEKRVDPDAAREVAAAAVRNRRVLDLLEQIAAQV